MANMIVLLPETESRLEAQFRLLFVFLANVRQCFKWGNRVAITDSIPANKGLCLVSSMIILLQLMSVYLLCHQHEHGNTLGLLFRV